MAPAVGITSGQTYSINYPIASKNTIFNMTGITVGNFQTIASGSTTINVFF